MHYFTNTHFRSPPRKFKISLKIDPCYHRQRCSAVTVVSGNRRFVQIFVGVPWRRGIKWQCGNQNVNFQGFRMLRLRKHRKWGQRYCIVLFSPLSLFHWPQNTWPWMILNGYFTLNFHYYKQCFRNCFYIVTVEPIYILWPVEMCRSGLWSAEYLGSTEKL